MNERKYANYLFYSQIFEEEGKCFRQQLALKRGVLLIAHLH